MSDAPPDADILAMQRLAAGDDLALNEIMHRWRDKVAAFLKRMTGDPDAAVDLAQETFVRLYQSCGSYTPTAAFPTYLFRIAANLARNHQRWRRRHPTVSLEEEEGAAGETAGDQSSPDAEMQSGERLRAVEAAIAALPPELREALLLFTYEDMSYAEIASTARRSVKTVEMRIYRARQMLKALLKELES
ncbi:MAG TPA: sigma-70 family RNA polymerase sigma factor [Prosthecobacter sp.]|nr:sigma-70 family RNA polymerase sigma factor [Prosthecobacter sp.]